MTCCRCKLELIIILLVIVCGLVYRIKGEDVLLCCDDVRETVVDNLFCTVTGFQVSHSDNVKIAKMEEAHLKRFMKFYSSVLIYIPAKLFDVFNSLTNFDASHTEIIDIPRHTFTSAGLLITLNLSYNRLERLTSSVFVGASKLMRLDLSNNRLSSLSNLTFRGLNDLTSLLLSHNCLTSLPVDLFVENTYLDKVDLSSNRLEVLQPQLFQDLANIREVNLTNNRLKYIHPDTFTRTYALEYLSLASNQLIDFYLTNKTIINFLDLSDNRLGSLLINGTQYVYAKNNRIGSLQILNSLALNALMLRNNCLSDMSNITGLIRLQELDLSYNPLGTPKISTYQRLERLSALSLAGTGITQLKFGMFSKLNNLNKLDLSYNNLSELNLEMFVPGNDHITKFYVDGNNLSEIQGKYHFAQAFHFLAELGISLNRFNCSYLHWLLMTPHLLESTRLHIEMDNGLEERTHIRDVTCISESHEDIQRVVNDLHNSNELRDILQQSLATMSRHAEQMQSYLMVMKICFVVLIAAVICILVFWQYRHSVRSKFYVRQGAPIVYHSNAAVNTLMDT